MGMLDGLTPAERVDFACDVKLHQARRVRRTLSNGQRTAKAVGMSGEGAALLQAPVRLVDLEALLASLDACVDMLAERGIVQPIEAAARAHERHCTDESCPRRFAKALREGGMGNL